MEALASFFKKDWQFFQYSLIKKINGIFYFLQRTPGIKKLISERIYATYKLKRVLGIFLAMVIFLYSLAKKVLVFALVMLLQVFLVTFFEGRSSINLLAFIIHPSMLQQGTFLWFLFVVLLGGFYNQYLAIVSSRMLDFCTEFNLSRNKVILGYKFLVIIKHAFFYFLVSLLYVFFADNPILLLFIPCSYLAVNFVFLVFCRWLYMLNYSTTKRTWIGVIFTGIILIMVISWYYFDLVAPLTTIFTSWMFLPIWFLLIFLGVKGAWNYPRQNEFIRKLSMQTLSFYENISIKTQENNEYIGEGLKMQKELQVNHDEQVDKLKGSEYLNALLFSRYRHVFNRKILRLIIGFSGVAVSLMILRVISFNSYIEETELVQILPWLFLLMYFLSFGKPIVQMLFTNCDSSMLYYPFYREGSTILKGFTYRLKQTFKYNSLIILGIFLLFTLLQVLNNFYLSWQFFGVLLLLLIALGLLFSFHELFIYYLLQPFTADMSVKSPLYKIVNWLFYFFSYMNIQVKHVSMMYVISISVISILYVVIGLVIIYRVAPKTFKIKE